MKSNEYYQSIPLDTKRNVQIPLKDLYVAVLGHSEVQPYEYVDGTERLCYNKGLCDYFITTDYTHRDKQGEWELHPVLTQVQQINMAQGEYNRRNQCERIDALGQIFFSPLTDQRYKAEDICEKHGKYNYTKMPLLNKVERIEDASGQPYKGYVHVLDKHFVGSGWHFPTNFEMLCLALQSSKKLNVDRNMGDGLDPDSTISLKAFAILSEIIKRIGEKRKQENIERAQQAKKRELKLKEKQLKEKAKQPITIEDLFK